MQALMLAQTQKQRHVPLAFNDSGSDSGSDGDSSSDDDIRAHIPHESQYVPTPLVHEEKFIVDLYINTPEESVTNRIAHVAGMLFDDHDASTQEPVYNVYGTSSVVHLQFADFNTPDIEKLCAELDLPRPVHVSTRAFQRDFGTYTLHFTVHEDYDSTLNVEAVVNTGHETEEQRPEIVHTRSGRASRRTRHGAPDVVNYGRRFYYRTRHDMPQQIYRELRRKETARRMRTIRGAE